MGGVNPFVFYSFFIPGGRLRPNHLQPPGGQRTGRSREVPRAQRPGEGSRRGQGGAYQHY